MKSKTFWRVIKKVQHKSIYFPGLMGRGLLPFAWNFVIASFLLVLFEAAEAGRLQDLFAGLTWSIGATFVICLLWPVLNYAFESGVVKTTAHIRKELFAHIQRLPYSYTQEHHSGNLISRLTNDVKAMEGVYFQSLLSIVSTVISGAMSLAIMFSRNWQLALMVATLGVGFVILNTFFAKRLRKTSERVQNSLGRVTELLADILAGLTITRVFGLEKIVQQKYDKENDHVLDLSNSRVKDNAILNGVNFFTGFMGFGGIMLVGGLFVLQGQTSFGEVIFMVQMQNSVNGLIGQMGNLVTQLQTSLAGAERVLKILDTAPESPSRLETSQLAPQGSGAIEIRNLRYGYSQGDDVLVDFNLSVPRGKVYAVVGSSGSGKSTLFKLLLGLYQPLEGEIVLSGRPLKGSTLSDLRRETAYVPQDSYLFSGTIRENIAAGKVGASDKEIVEAAAGAYADQFIRALPNGYDTQVGERGAHLSGGQRQRIAIARAIIKNAPILLLDEATSALDTESEQLVQKALHKLMAGRTSLVVAHRLATIENADQILVLNQGVVVERGTHQELLAKEAGFYRHLYDLQYCSHNAAC